MINQELLHPRSIVVIGGSNNVHKPGGAIVRNIKNGGFEGELHIVNPKEDEVQGIKVFHDVKDIPQTDLAILVVAARFCPDYVDFLCAEKGVRAFVIISAGFGEETKEGATLEQRILDTCERYPSSRDCSSTACGVSATASRSASKTCCSIWTSISMPRTTPK